MPTRSHLAQNFWMISSYERPRFAIVEVLVPLYSVDARWLSWETGTPTSQKWLLQCTKTGERCKLKHGPLGVCMPLIDAPKTYECVPQH